MLSSGLVSIPVLIPARNEEAHIRAALEALTPQAEAIVIPNGCNDATAEIARRCGAKVIGGCEEGKVPALQAGIRHLGERALEPFVILDADSRPVFPQNWLSSLLATRRTLNPDTPALVTGGVVLVGGPSVATNVYRSARSVHTLITTRNSSQAGKFYGANMLIHSKTDEVIDEILSLPQIWPGEDRIIKDIVLASGGLVRKSARLGSLVFTDVGRYTSLRQRLIEGRERTIATVRQLYANDAPPGAISAEEYQKLQTSPA